MTFGLQCDEATSLAILDAGFDAGITFLDTADVYPLGGDLTTVGRTEDIIGRWLAKAPGRRDDVVIATKCNGVMGPKPWHRGNNRRHIHEAVDASLRRLGVEAIDLYQVHSFDPSVSHDETLTALNDLVRIGKVRYLGCSNYVAYQLARAVGRSEALGIARFDCVQPRYNLLYRYPERELLPLCEDEGIGVIPYNPLAGGFLSGKHRPGPPTEGTRFTLGNSAAIYQERYWNERDFSTVEHFVSIAKEAGIVPAQLSVAWCLAHPAVTSPIIGASRPDQLADSVAAVSLRLDADLKAKLDDLTLEYRNHPAVR